MIIHVLKRAQRILLARAVITTLGMCGVLATTNHTHASIEQERKHLDSRIAAAREIIRNKDTSKNQITNPKESTVKLAQWYPWGNWGNWRNW